MSLRRLAIPLVLTASIPLAAVIALEAGGAAAMAALGAALAFLHWALEQGAMALGRRGGARQAITASVVGVVVRYIIIGSLLVTAGVLNRGGFISCALAFVAVFTLLLTTRIARGFAASSSGRVS